MMISRESDYALRILRYLADGELRKAQKICDEELIPKQFTYKILKKLENAEMIKIKHGAGGGCTIAKDVNEISLYSVLKAVGDDLGVNACTSCAYNCKCKEKHGECQYHEKLMVIQEKIRNEFDSVSIGDILKKCD